MKREPINYNNPLGISKKEWTRVLGVNLALLILVYSIALVCTLCGSDFFLIKGDNAYLESMENVMRSWNVYALVQIGFATVEEMIILCFVMLRKPKWWWPVLFFGLRVINNVVWFNTTGAVPVWASTVINIGFILVFVAFEKKKALKPLLRFAIAFALSLLLNEAIAILRTKIWEIHHDYTNIALFYLSFEYHLALSLALGLLAIAIPWNRAKGEQQWVTTFPAGGSSPTSRTKLRTNSEATKNNLSERQRKKLRLLKARMFIIQTVALVFICLFPVLIGKPAEFAMMYVSFCLTRLVLGFNRFLHFKSELVCVTTGAIVFWALTLLTPRVEVSIIMSLVYGGALALGFRLYWELHDLLVYKRASKNDRYAMLYVAFKGNLDNQHIRGVMRLRGYTNEDDIKMVQLYMCREKVDFIATYLNYAKITIEKKLTDISIDLYERR